VKACEGSILPSRKKKSRKKQADPWWFSPTRFDVVFKAKVYRQFNSVLLQKIAYEFARAQYPTRSRRAKNDWTEPVVVDAATYLLSCSIDENNRKIVVTYIRPPKKMLRTRRR